MSKSHSSYDPKISATLGFYAPKNKSIIKSILMRANKDIWAEINRTIISDFLKKLKSFGPDDKTLFNILCLLYAKLLAYGYPFPISDWTDKFKLESSYQIIKLDDIIMNTLDYFVDQLIEQKINLHKYLDIKPKSDKNTLINFENKSFFHFPMNPNIISEEIIFENKKENVKPDKSEVIDDVIDDAKLPNFFGFQNDSCMIKIQLEKRKLAIDFANIIKFIQENPLVDYKILKFSLKVYNRYIQLSEKLQKHYFYTIIIKNNNINLNRLIDERFTNVIYIKNDLKITKPKCKMRTSNVYNFKCIANDNFDKIKEISESFVTSYMGYPIIGSICNISEEKYGYYVISQVNKPIDLIKISNDEYDWTNFNFPKIKLRTPIEYNKYLNIYIK